MTLARGKCYKLPRTDGIAPPTGPTSAWTAERTFDAKDRAMEKTALITGITGQVGGAVARALLAEGANVRAVVRDASKAAATPLF